MQGAEALLACLEPRRSPLHGLGVFVRQGASLQRGERLLWALVREGAEGWELDPAWGAGSTPALRLEPPGWQGCPLHRWGLQLNGLRSAPGLLPSEQPSRDARGPGLLFLVNTGGWRGAPAPNAHCVVGRLPGTRVWRVSIAVTQPVGPGQEVLADYRHE